MFKRKLFTDRQQVVFPVCLLNQNQQDILKGTMSISMRITNISFFHNY